MSSKRKTPSNNAVTQPVATNEVHTADLPIEQPSAIVVPPQGPIVRETEQIAVADKPIESEYAKALAFGEEVLDVMLQPSSEENAPEMIDAAVNGETVWLKVGVPTKMKRKFVEVLLRAKPIAVQTVHEGAEGKPEVINNQIRRTTRAKFPLSILRDPSPKGGEWLNRVMRETY